MLLITVMEARMNSLFMVTVGVYPFILASVFLARYL